MFILVRQKLIRIYKNRIKTPDLSGEKPCLWLKTAVQGVVLCDELNTDCTDLTDAIHRDV